MSTVLFIPTVTILQVFTTITIPSLSTTSVETLETILPVTFTATVITPIPTAFQVESSTAGTFNKGVIVGSIVGIVVIVICLCMYRFYMHRKRQNSRIFIDTTENDTDGYPGLPVTLHPAHPNGLELHPLPSPEAILRPSPPVSSRRGIDSRSAPFSNSPLASEHAERAANNLDQGDLSPRPTFESRLPEPSTIVPVMNPQTLRHSEAPSSLSGPSTALPLYASLALSPMPPSFRTLDPLSRHGYQTMSTLTMG